MGYRRSEDTGKSKLLPAGVSATLCATYSSSVAPKTCPLPSFIHPCTQLLRMQRAQPRSLLPVSPRSCSWALPRGIAPLGDRGDGRAAGPLGLCPRSSLSLGTITRKLGSAVGASSPSCALSGGHRSPETPPPNPTPRAGAAQGSRCFSQHCALGDKSRAPLGSRTDSLAVGPPG